MIFVSFLGLIVVAFPLLVLFKVLKESAPIEVGFVPIVPGFISFPTANFPKFLNLKGIISKTFKGKYFKLWVKNDISLVSNSISLWYI